MAAPDEISGAVIFCFSDIRLEFFRLFIKIIKNQSDHYEKPH